MKRITLWLLAAAASSWAVGIGAADDGGWLAAWDGRVVNDAGAVTTLAPGEYAAVSPHGDAYAIVALKAGVFPPRTRVRVYDKNGGELWSVEDTTAIRAVVADTGAAVLVTMKTPEPTTTCLLESYDAGGRRTGEVESPLIGAATFAPGTSRAAFVTGGGKTKVFDAAAGTLAYELPAAEYVAAGPGERFLLITSDHLTLYARGARKWETSPGLYFPRLAVFDAAGTYALVGAHHEVALITLAGGRVVRKWTAADGFAVTDLAASPDLKVVGVGLRSLQGMESAVMLDGNFKLLAQQDRRVAQPSGVSPVVAAFGGDSPRVIALGQGWQATLAR